MIQVYIVTTIVMYDVKGITVIECDLFSDRRGSRDVSSDRCQPANRLYRKRLRHRKQCNESVRDDNVELVVSRVQYRSVNTALMICGKYLPYTIAENNRSLDEQPGYLMPVSALCRRLPRG